MGYMTGGTAKALVLTAALLATPGCAQLHDILLDPYHPSARTVVLEGEIRSVDTRRGRFQVRDEHGRGTRTVMVDRNTDIVYRRHEFGLGALERGDLVRVYAEIDRRGDAWAERVDVRESVNERGRGRY